MRDLIYRWFRRWRVLSVAQTLLVCPNARAYLPLTDSSARDLISDALKIVGELEEQCG